ncbi:MAG: FAD-dependent oxidoreductase, partial [Pseudomonadota bacterium]
PKVLQDPRVVPAKPFATLMAAIPAVIEGKSIAVIGAGPAGLEVAFALKARRPELEITIVERAETLLPAFPRGFAQRIGDHLDRVGIGLSLAEEVVAVLPEDVRLQSGKSIASEGIVAFTGAAPPKILETAPFARAEDGFIAVDNTMRSVSHPNVLAVGDVATRIDDPRPKAGVFAVRSGPLLARAVTDLVEGRPLRPAPLQKRGLVLLSLGGRRAVGVRNGVVVEGRLVWRLKDRFDRAFVDRFRVS